MSLDLDSRVAQSHRTASRIVEGQAVVIVIDAQTLHTLNSVGTVVWAETETAVAISEIIDRVVSEFEVSRDDAQRDVLEFAGELIDMGALTVVREDG